MSQNESSVAEELLDSTGGLNGLPGTTPQLWSQQWSTPGDSLQRDSAASAPSTREMLDPDRPSKRIKLSPPTDTDAQSSLSYIHTTSPPQPPVTAMSFSSSSRSGLAQKDAYLTTPSSSFSAQDPPFLTSASVAPSVPIPEPVPQSGPTAAKSRRDSDLAEGSNRTQRHSPFKELRDTVGLPSLHTQGFSIRDDRGRLDEINGYIKGRDPKSKKPAQPKPAQHPQDHQQLQWNQNNASSGTRDIADLGHFGPFPHTSDMTQLVLPQNPQGAVTSYAGGPESIPVGVAPDFGAGTIVAQDMSMGEFWFLALSMARQTPFPPTLDGTTAVASPVALQPHGPDEEANRSNDPRMLELVKQNKVPSPSNGVPSNLSDTQRKFAYFYRNNWCPGRTILLETNVWLKDFAPFAHANEYVRHAMDSLVGVYIFDYTKVPSVAKHANKSFALAEARLTKLLNQPRRLNTDEANEFVTITVLLSMQDIVFVERRKKHYQRARWLEGFQQCETILHDRDTRDRFWKRDTRKAQLDSLQLSLSICVCRNVILAQPLMHLPDPQTFDSTSEMDRFSWLLTGSEDDMFAIHGACGFSKMLLYHFSQVTLFAAMSRQADNEDISSIFAEQLLKGLQEMRQYSKESIAPERNTWEAAKLAEPVIEGVRQRPEDYVIVDRHEMTDVTAEAWRFAAMIYLQCRALRLPRDHPSVMANMGDLAACIRIMPTGGPLFTAQAPLLPVFFLGALAVDARHKQASRKWFEDVVSAPVRSSVPPLFDALRDIWKWIDQEIPIRQQSCDHVSERDPWWERLIAIVRKTQKETLCLT